MKLNSSKLWLSLTASLALSLPLVLSCGKDNPSKVDRLAATTVDNAVVAEVLQNLHSANQDEIAAGKLAQEQGSDKEVKDLGKVLVDDHTKADQQVTDVAKRANVNLDGGESAPPAPGTPTTPAPAPGTPATGPTQPAAPSSGNTSPGNSGGGLDMPGEAGGDPFEMLRNLRGQEFDREFLSMMVDDHQEMIQKLDAALPQLGDSETAKLVKQLRPVIQTHLDRAKQILQRLGGSRTPEKGKEHGKCGGKGQQDCQQQGKPPVTPVPPKPVTPPSQQQQQQSPTMPVAPKPVTPVAPKPVTPAPVAPKPVTPPAQQQGPVQTFPRPEQGQQGLIGG